ncbi:hypothetical protein OESDEN_19084 [Oesophagostomum dentatum]|uniref:Bridge-like lipid transfer protein family member 1 C-terminal domain-containing protein n=1 Tax=Oesophagostomum dentatum TaxID=61180 RepID=A0A0B1SDF8_OESDE|nr:hypothetical protein OESDEN_19084 [Oesophagostomum dentatum]
MRRLSELIAFPKPWYRAAIARRVFFGDQAMSREPASQPSTIASHNLPTTSTGITIVRTDKAWSATVLLAVQWKELNVNAQMSNTMGNTSWKARRGLLRAIAKQPPRNGAKVQLRWLAARVEWMSRAILIGRCEKPAISLGDEFSREKNDAGEVFEHIIAL